MTEEQKQEKTSDAMKILDRITGDDPVLKDMIKEEIVRLKNEEINYLEIETTFNAFAKLCHKEAQLKGFYADMNTSDVYHIATKIALIGDEVFELLRAFRNPTESWVIRQSEMADIIIRVLDFAYWMGYTNIGTAIVDKYIKNKGRPFKHGKLF